MYEEVLIFYVGMMDMGVKTRNLNCYLEILEFYTIDVKQTLYYSYSHES